MAGKNMEINYIKLGITLFLALTLSSLVVDGVEAYFAGQILIETTKKLKVQNQQNQTKLAAQAQENERRNQARIETNRKKVIADRKKAKSLQSIRNTNDETCIFWTQEYLKSKSEYRKQMKISACNRARND